MTVSLGRKKVLDKMAYKGLCKFLFCVFLLQFLQEWCLRSPKGLRARGSDSLLYPIPNNMKKDSVNLNFNAFFTLKVFI